jgi:hypothetical protein
VENLCPTIQTIGSFMENLVHEHKRVVILTCGKFLTGTDIPVLGHVVLWDRMESVANFEQLLGRMIREYPGKKDTKMYVMAPGSAVSVVLGRMAQKNAELGGGNEYEVLDCIPLSEYMGKGYKAFSAEQILEETQKWFQSHVRDRLSSVSLTHVLADSDILADWKILDLKKFKNMLPKIKLSDDIGAKVRARVRKADRTPAEQRELENQLDVVVRIMQNVVFEVQWVAYSMDTWDWTKCITNPAIVGMFGQEVVDLVAQTIQSKPALDQMVRDHLQTKQQAYKNLPAEQVYEELFGNSKLKQSIGLVYVPFGLARELVKELPV